MARQSPIEPEEAEMATKVEMWASTLRTRNQRGLYDRTHTRDTTSCITDRSLEYLRRKEHAERMQALDHQRNGVEKPVGSKRGNLDKTLLRENLMREIEELHRSAGLRSEDLKTSLSRVPEASPQTPAPAQPPIHSTDVHAPRQNQWPLRK